MPGVPADLTRGRFLICEMAVPAKSGELAYDPGRELPWVWTLTLFSWPIPIRFREIRRHLASASLCATEGNLAY